MALLLFGYPKFPNDFGVTEIDIQPNECAFFLDFQRPLKKVRSYSFLKISFGPVVGILVPISHASEKIGGYCIAADRSEPYYLAIVRLWKEHRGHPREMITTSESPGQIIADFGTHFSGYC